MTLRWRPATKARWACAELAYRKPLPSAKDTKISPLLLPIPLILAADTCRMRRHSRQATRRSHARMSRNSAVASIGSHGRLFVELPTWEGLRRGPRFVSPTRLRMDPH
jgi:hypothetical protein